MEGVTPEQILANWLFSKHQYIKQQLFKPLKDEYGEYTDDMEEPLKKEMLEAAKWILATEMCLKLHLGSDCVLEFISGMNLQELLK